jgi:hypothetical protein
MDKRFYLMIRDLRSLIKSQDAEDRSLIDPEYRDAEGEPENSPTSSQEGSDGYRPYGIMADDGAIMPIPEELISAAGRPHIDEGEEKGEEDDIAMEVDVQVRLLRDHGRR